MMFGIAHPERSGTAGQAMLTLFLLLSLDGITDTLQAGREVTEWAVLYRDVRCFETRRTGCGPRPR
jgi:voltage-gated sodium channel